VCAGLHTAYVQLVTAEIESFMCRTGVVGRKGKAQGKHTSVVVLCCALQRLGRENAALLARAGVDELDQLTTSDLDMPSSQQQQQQQLLHLPDSAAAAAAQDTAPSREITVEALSATDQPVDQQQQQQGEGAEDLPEYLQGVADMLEGVEEWQQQQERVRAVLKKAGGWGHGRSCVWGGGHEGEWKGRRDMSEHSLTHSLIQ